MGMPVLYRMCKIERNTHFYYFFIKIIISSQEHEIWLQENNRNFNL